MRENIELFEGKKNSANVVIVVVTIVSFLVMQLWEKGMTDGKFYGHTTEFLLEHGALYGPYIKEGQWYRLVTYMLLHGDMAHLLNNMLVLYCLGNALEHYVGKIPYVLIYFFSGILAALGSVVYNTDSPVCVGASGAVFGVIGAMLWLVLRHRGRVEGFTKNRMLLFVAISVYGGFTGQGVDNAAHIAGLLAGFLLTVLIYRKPKEPDAEMEVVP